LIAAGIGSVVFIGMGTLSGLSTSDYALGSLGLAPPPALGVNEFVWAIVLEVVGAILVRAILELAWKTEDIVMTRPMVLIPVAGLVVAAMAIAFAQVTGQTGRVGVVLGPGCDGADRARRQRPEPGPTTAPIATTGPPAQV
jgi:hypothetical protein